MAISIDSLERRTANKPARLIVYGPPGLGKTTLASEFPNPVFIQTEDGTPGGLELDSFGEMICFGDVMEALSVLLNESHDFQTVVIDSIDKLEPTVWAQTCDDNKWANIETPGYGKGYVSADGIWREYFMLCRDLRNRGMTTIHLAHSAVERFDDPQTVSYSRYDIRLHKRALALFQDEMDAILFLNQDVTAKTNDAGFGKKEAKGVGGGTRWIYTEGRPSFVAKNRYGMPEKLMFQLGSGYAALAPYLPAQAVEQETAPQKMAAKKTKAP